MADSMGCVATVQTSYDVDVRYNIPYGAGNRQIASMGYVNYRQDFANTAELEFMGVKIPSYAYVPFENYIRSLAKLNEQFEMDIQYNVPMGEKLQDKYSKVSVPNKRDFPSRVLIEPTKTERRSRAFVAYERFLASVAKINERFEMDVKYQFVQPPLQEMLLFPIQDSFIRQARPTLNYGKNQTLMVGSSMEGEFRALIEIDFSKYAKITNAQARKMELVLNLASDPAMDTYIDVHEVFTTWYEEGVTWSSDIRYNPTPTFSFIANSQQIRINVKSYVEQLLKRKVNKMSFLFKLRDESVDNIFYIRSKETPEENLRPHLELRYVDKTWTGYLDKKEIRSLATLRRQVYSNFMSKFNTFKHFDAMTGRLTITDPKNKYSRALINSPDAFHKARIYIPRDISSIATIRQKDWDDMESTVHKFPSIPSKVTLQYSGPIYSTAEIRWELYDDSDTHQATITRPDMWSKINLVLSKPINSLAHIRALEHGPLDSKARLINGRIRSKARIFRARDIASMAVIRGRINDDKESIAGIKRDGIFSKSNLYQVNNKNSIAFLRGTIKEDKRSIIHIKGAINYPVYSIANIIHVDNRDIASKIIISSDWNIDELASVATILRNEDKDIRSKGTLRGFTAKPISSVADIVYRGNGDLGSLVNIVKFRDIPSLGTVRVEDNWPIHSIADIVYPGEDLLHSMVNTVRSKNLPSFAIRRITDQKEITGIAVIRQVDINELESFIYVRGGYASCPIDSVALVRRVLHDYFYCQATIISRARRWVPNVHAPEVFNYKNRKLPRQWKRQDFISD